MYRADNVWRYNCSFNIFESASTTVCAHRAKSMVDSHSFGVRVCLRGYGGLGLLCGRRCGSRCPIVVPACSLTWGISHCHSCPQEMYFGWLGQSSGAAQTQLAQCGVNWLQPLHLWLLARGAPISILADPSKLLSSSVRCMWQAWTRQNKGRVRCPG